MANNKVNQFYDVLQSQGINMPKDRSVFERNMRDPKYRRTLYDGLEERGFEQPDYNAYESFWSNELLSTTNDTSKTYGVMASDAYTNRYTRQAEEQRIDQETKAEEAKNKQIADNYNAMSKLEDTFAAYEQSQDVAELFPGAKSESSTTWRDRVAKRKEGEAQAKAKVDQEREELRQRMQLLKDNPDAWGKSLEQPLQTNAPEVGLRSMESFANGKPVDKRGNVHDNWVSQAQANQRIDAEDKARQLGMQADEIQDMLADPMALDKEMSKLKAELAELTKQRDAYGSQFAKEHPWQMMANLMGRDSFDNPYEVGMYGVDAMETQMQMNNVIARINMLTEAKNAFERGSWSGHGFWNNVKNIGKGMQQFATEINSYTDKYDIESGMALNNLANKIERGEMLTDEEMSWFVTAKLKEEGEKAASQGPTTGAVGYGAPASVEYMVTMALNPARGASKTISDKIIEAGVRRFGKSAFTKMMAKATGMLTEGAVLSTTLGADNVTSDALGRMAGRVGFDDGGNVAVADRVNPLKAMYQSTMASTIESAVEMMGVPIIGKATKGIGKVATKLADAMSYGKVSKLLSAMDKSQIVNWTKGMSKATGWQGLGEEWGEENVTMLANAIIVGDNEIADMFDTRTQLEILGTCALISGVMSTANVAGFATEFHKVNREYKKAKQEVLRQFSSDVWASLDNLITNAQDEDLTVRLADAMDGMAMNREQRSAIMNYLTALKRYQKFNELNDGGKFIIGGPQQAQATQSTSTSTSTYEIDSDITLKDEIGNPIDAHIIGRDANGNYMVESSQPINGKRVQPLSADQLDAMVIPNTPDGIQQSEVDGYNLTDANQQAEVSMLTDNARESVATLLGVTPDVVDATLQQVLGDNPTDTKIDARFGDNAQVVKDYMYNVAKTKGMSARLADDIADATAESDRAIDEVSNNGNVVTAKDAEGNDVNVVSGNIVTYEDGQIDVANSDASVVIRHADGTTEMVAPTSLTEVVSMPTEQAKATQAQAIAQQMQQAFSDRLNGALDYSQGQQYTMLNADGSTTDVTILADNGDGNVTVTARDGNKEGGVTDGKQIVLPKSQIQQGVREFKRNQLRGETAQQASIPQAVQPTEVAEPIQEPSMPTDEQGNVLYEQMDADSAWDALLAETGGDADMAMTVANEMIADKTKAVEEASKMVAEPGTTPQEKIANLKAVKQAQAQAQAELDAWKAIAETPNRRMSIAEEATTESVVESTPTESESTPQVGLVEDARTRTLGDKTRKMLDAMAKRLGLQVEFVDEIVTGKDEKGRKLYANAVIVGNKVKIAWHNRNRAIDFLLGHEFTHRMQDLSPEAYAEFVEATKQALGEEEWNKRIKDMRDIYKSQGKTISEQGIIDEVVADYAGELVEERGVFDNFVERNKDNRGLLSAIADVLRSIKEFFTLGKQRKIDNAIARLEALIESASEVVASIADVAETDSEIPRFNLMTEGEVASKLRDFVESKEGRALGWTQEQMEQMINETEWLINSIDSALQGDTNYEEWRERKPTITTDWRDGETKPTVTWSRGNIEYKYDMSADLLCINNEGLESVLSSPIMAELMTKAMPNFTSNDYSTLYQVLKDKGFVVPCAGCFDFAMRLKMLPSVAQKFVQLTNEVIDERNKNPEAFDEMVRQRAKEGKQTVEGLPISASDKKKAIELAVVGDNLTEHLDWHDFLSAEGQTEILSKYGGLFRAWQRTGAGRPKDKLLPEPWIGEMASPRIGTIIAPLDAKTPSYRADDVNVGTGLRRNSHSEYRPALVVDEIQMMREAFVKNLLVFKYMKELDDVRMFGELGVKYNMSFFPAFDPNGVAAGLDANGEYIASEESVGAREFEYTDADGKIHYDGMKGRDEALKYTNENVSLSAVAFSVPHLIKLMTDVPTPQKPDGWVGSIIGYYAGGATASQMAKQGLGKARAASPDASNGAFEVEAMTDYNKGVTNFEQVQNDRFGEGWVVVEGKKAGEKVSKGHKLEFVNGKHYYNESLGVHLFSNGYVYDSELPNGKVTADIKKNPPHPLTIDYNDKVRELNSDYGYMEASDYYTEELHKIGMIPRFEFVVPEDIFLQMCADAKRSPYDPNLGWEGKGHDWNPSDAPAYYALWCDYGMTVPGTGKWSPHRPVGYIDAYGNRSFRLPENVVDIAKDAMSRYTDRRNRENAMTNDAIVEFCKRSIDLGAMDEKKAEDILNKNGFSLNDNPTPPQKTRFSLTGEEQSIVDEAKANGTYLKAPNGKASNLNERQWIQVRTKAFKDWFGDWENDPENASKVVDENGEPKVVYHGSIMGGFASFRKSNTGIFFADSRKAVEDYAYEDTEDVDNYLPFDRYSEISVEDVNEWISNANLRQLEKGSYIKEHKVLNDVYWELLRPNDKPYILHPSQMKYILLEYARTSPEFKGKGVYSAYLDMKNPFVIDAESKSWSDLPKTINGVTIPEKYMVVHQKQTVSTDEWAEFLQSEEGRKLGFDGMIVDNVYDSHTADGTITDYIAFEPTQIKSATDNVGTFDASNPDIRYSLIGEQGATALDKAEEATHRMDNLAVARDMEAEGKDAKSIRMATGWERGADGKWRYEIEDVKLKRVPLHKNENNQIVTTLGEIVDAEELFKAYPQLKELDVISLHGVNELGQYHGGKIYPFIGLNIKTFKPSTVESLNYRLLVEKEDIFSNEEEMIDFVNKWEEADDKAIENPEFYVLYDYTDSILIHEIQHAIQDFEGFAEGGRSDILGLDTYERLAGEVEARSVEKRRGMTPEQRRETLLRETEDVAREDQIFLMKNGDASRYSLQGAFYSNAHHAVEDIKQDKATPQQWIAMLKKNGGLKAGEDKWLGLEDWLNQQRGSVTKQDIIDYINANSIKIEEVKYSEDSKYEDIASEIRSMWDAIYDTAEEMAREQYEYEDDEIVDWNYINDNIVDILESDYGEDILDHIEFDDEGSISVVGEQPIDGIRLQYTTKGLEGKREIALTIPTIDPYNKYDSIHFGDAGGGRAVAWIRFGETEDAEGNRVLVIDEIQSKRHQDGREKGYQEHLSDVEKARMTELKAYIRFGRASEARKVVDFLKSKGFLSNRKEEDDFYYNDAYLIHNGKFDEFVSKYGKEAAELFQTIENRYVAKSKELDELERRTKGVPSAPFEKNWQELAMKRMLRYATDFGFDKLAWTTGEQQAKRYGLGEFFDSIVSSDWGDRLGETDVKEVYGDGRAELQLLVDRNGVIVGDVNDQFNNRRLDEVVGKEIADKLLADGKVELSDIQLRLGGEGMKGFYDKMLPSFMNKYGKKWGVKVGEVTMPNLEEGYQTMHSVDVTDAMREDVRKGQPLFSLQGGRSIADKYEKRVNTKGVGGAMRLSKFNAQEAFQDGELALKEVQRITEQEYGIVLESYEDAYKAENALSSVNQAEWERYIKDYYEPMMQIIDKWILKGSETEQSVNHYLIAKSGLERNREFTVRDALAEMDKMDRQIINGAYSGTVLQLANALRQGQISQDEYNAQVQDAKDKKNQALENIKNAQQTRVDAYRAERDALREQLKNGDITYEEFNQLSDEVAIRHAKVEEIKDYSGLTALAKQYNEKDWRNFAEQMVVNFENKHDNTDVLWERINNATKKAVEKSYESGITSKEAKNHLDQMFLWYVPMGGMENDTAEDIYSYLNRNADSAFTQTVKRAEGHSEHISDDVMAMIANTMQSAILQGNRNKMKQKFLNMVENYPTDLFTLDRGWVVMQGNEWVESHPEIKADYTAEQVRDAINAHNEEMRNLEEQGLAMSKEGALKLGIPLKNKRNEQEHAISVMRNGQKVTIYVNGNPRVAQALNGKLKDVEQTWIGKAYGKLKRYFSASKTSWNPDFVSSNFSRDIGYSTGVTFAKHGIGEWGRSVVMYAPAIATLVAKALGKKSPWGAKYDQYFDEFVRNGGVTGYSHLYSVDDWKIENTKRIDRLRGVAKAIKAHNNLWVNLGKVYNEINSIIENSSRFNEYTRSRNRGEDVATSVWNAKEITLNFNKKGSSKTEGLFGGLAFLGRNLVPFFNPIMQGIYQFLKIGKEHKRRMTALCFGYMGMGFMQPFVNAMLVELLGGGDEDDYMKQPEYTRRTNFMLYTGDGYIKIPLAQIFREFYGIGDVVYCAMYGKLSEEDATSQAISQVRRIFSLDDVSTYFDWVADIATNTNFMGNPLWKENDYNKYKPEYTKAYDNTWSFLVSASKWINEALGGDEHTAPEDFNSKWINPAIWQRVLSELGGGALTSVLDVYDTASALAHGEDVDWANVPIAKRLYTETDEETLQKWIDKEYFSNLDNYKMVRDRMSSLKSSNALDVAEKIDFMYHNPKYLEYVIFDDAQKEIKELRDKADSATDDNRAEREKALYDAELEVVEAIDAVRAMEDNEVQTYMMEHPEVAYYINKDIEKKVKGNVKELQKAIARKEPDARKALTAYRKTPEYKYYNQIRRILKRINKLESRLKDDSKNVTPSQRLKWQKQIDDKKQELVELRKAYESIGEIKE